MVRVPKFTLFPMAHRDTVLLPPGVHRLTSGPCLSGSAKRHPNSHVCPLPLTIMPFSWLSLLWRKLPRCTTSPLNHLGFQLFATLTTVEKKISNVYFTDRQPRHVQSICKLSRVTHVVIVENGAQNGVALEDAFFSQDTGLSFLALHQSLILELLFYTSVSLTRLRAV